MEFIGYTSVAPFTLARRKGVSGACPDMTPACDTVTALSSALVVTSAGLSLPDSQNNAAHLATTLRNSCRNRNNSSFATLANFSCWIQLRTPNAQYNTLEGVTLGTRGTVVEDVVGVGTGCIRGDSC